jgi:alkylation response protein AidB-like acyl-CoA dehydrogenase
VRGNCTGGPRTSGASALKEQNGALTGEKLFVTDAAVADYLVVTTKTAVFIVEKGAAGLASHR